MKKYVITCEHAGNFIPQAYCHLFLNAEISLQSHRGWDIGALSVAQSFSQTLKAPLFQFNTSRLLIEVNRSLHHKDLFSCFSQQLNCEERQHLIDTYYIPYRQSVTEQIEKLINNKHEVVHISVHSFTPILDGNIRHAEIGLLYDDAHKAEHTFCTNWQHIVAEKAPYLRVKMNYPYQGKDDGFTTSLREKFPKHYLGIELEINQKLFGFYKVNEIAHYCLPISAQ